MSTSSLRPLARPDTIVSELEDEVLLYDFETHGAHCVSKVAFRVYQLCDGKRTLRGIATELAQRGAAVSEVLVAQAVNELTTAGLLYPAPSGRTTGRAVDLSRRDAMKKMALTVGLSVAVPMVWSIVAPSVAEAASTMCVSTSACMGAGTSGVCCGTSGGSAGTCSGNMCSIGGSCFGLTCH